MANTASKFELKGTAQALQIALCSYGIGFTVINPGNVAPEDGLTNIEEGRFLAQVLIPIADLIFSIEWILSLSKAVDVADLNLSQRDL